MGRLTEILEAAQTRARQKALPYDGALHPAEAHELRSLAPGAVLVDVRTRAEWDWVGRIPGCVEIEWQTYPGAQANPGFGAQLQAQVDRESLVMFLCRSGARSHGAATNKPLTRQAQLPHRLRGFLLLGEEPFEARLVLVHLCHLSMAAVRLDELALARDLLLLRARGLRREEDRESRRPPLHRQRQCR